MKGPRAATTQETAVTRARPSGARLRALAACLFAAILLWSGASAPTRAAEAYTAEKVAALLEGTENGEIFRMLKAAFPDEYDAFVADMANRANNGASQAELNQMGFNFTSGLRRANAEFASAASDAIITENLESMLAITHSLESDTRLCAGYSIAGGSVLLGHKLSAEQFSLFAKNSELSFAAIADGKRRGGGAASEPTEGAWTAFFQHWTSRGATDADFETFFAQDVDNPEMCKLSIEFLEAMISMPGDVGVELRRFLVIQTLKT